MLTPPELGRTLVLDGGRRETSPLVPGAVSGMCLSSSAAEITGLSGPASVGTHSRAGGLCPGGLCPQPLAHGPACHPI